MDGCLTINIVLWDSRDLWMRSINMGLISDITWSTNQLNIANHLLVFQTRAHREFEVRA